jgi:hypothetical protein
MTDQDISRRTGRDQRPGALRDLRFAGTVAAGLVAGVLGVGAIAAPLVGWSEWPAKLSPERDGALTLNAPERSTPTSRPGPSGSGGAPAPAAVPGAVPVAAPGGITLVPATPGGAGAGPGAADRDAAARPRSGLSGAGGGPERSGRFGSTGFVEAADSDGDGMQDAYEQANQLDPMTNDAAADKDGDGIPNEVEFKLRTSAALNDSNGDGVLDGDDDTDRDGVRNGIELNLGSRPWDPDSDADGQTDGTEDPDSDGIPSSVEDVNGTDPGVSDTPADPEPAPEEPVAPAPVEPSVPVDNGSPRARRVADAGSAGRA